MEAVTVWHMNINGYEIEPGADLAQANLEGANLQGANLTGANLSGGSQRDTDLSLVQGCVMEPFTNSDP